jgi:hypothetical protein
MPFLPIVLLLVWQAVGRGAAFALGWATALYFGQVPGKQGAMLALISLLAAAWVLLLAGFGVPLLVGAALDALGAVPRNFDLAGWVVWTLVGALVLTPPLLAGLATWIDLHEEHSIAHWLSLVPVSYPATASLGFGVLEMVAFSPLLIVDRLRHKQVLGQMALTMKDGTDDDALQEAVAASLRAMGIDRLRVEEARGFMAWPLRTVGFAVTHLLGALVRGSPIYMSADGLEIYAYATNVAIIGPEADVHRARAALEREVPFHGAHLTWQEDTQRLEDELLEAGDSRRGTAAAQRRLDRIQERIDATTLAADEWNILYRLRLQVQLRVEQQEQEEEAREPARASG